MPLLYHGGVEGLGEADADLRKALDPRYRLQATGLQASQIFLLQDDRRRRRNTLRANPANSQMTEWEGVSLR
jgi:hypothetical protein